MKKAEIEEQGKAIIAMLEKKEENVELLNTFCSTIKNYKDMDETLYSFFIKTILMDVLKALMNIRYCSKIEFQSILTDILLSCIPILCNELPKGNIDTIRKAQSIFNYESALYQGPFNDIKDLKEILYDLDITSKWREKLKVGDFIDAMNEEKFTSLKLEGWALARIISQSSNKIEVVFIGYEKLGKMTFSKLSKNIAPKGSRVDDYYWRKNLKKGDLVDALDTQSDWYLSTVINFRIVGGGNKEIKIGYREYSLEGTKIDANGKKYNGWSESYDAWIPIHSLCIQRPNSISKLGTVYFMKRFDSKIGVVDDSSDVLKNWLCDKKQCYVTHRYNTDSSSLYLKLMTIFGQKGGFTRIYEASEDYSKRHKEKPALSIILEYLHLLSAPHPICHCYFVSKLIKPFFDLVINYMNSLSDLEWRNVAFDVVDRALKEVELLAKRIYTTKTRGEIMVKLKIGIALSLIQSDILERRVPGVLLAAETFQQIREAEEPPYLYVMSDNLNPILRRENYFVKLIKEIFGERSRIQLIDNSGEILRYIFLNYKISVEEFLIIWGCSFKEEGFKKKIFKVLHEVVGSLSSELQSLILNQYEILDKSYYDNQDASFILKLGNYSAQIPGKILEQLCNIMWKIIVNKISKIDLDLYDGILNKFCNLITTVSLMPFHTFKDYLERLFVMILEEDKSIIGMKALRKLLFQYAKTLELQRETEILAEILKEGEVLNNYFNSFHRYMKKAANLQLSNQLVEIEHCQELEERRQFLSFLISSAQFKLSLERIQFLWNMLVYKPVTLHDPTIFKAFIKEIFMQGIFENSFGTEKGLLLFFERVICDEKNEFPLFPAYSIQAIETEKTHHSCDKGHSLNWKTSLSDSDLFKTYQCKKCMSVSLLCSRGRWNCPQCQYNICPKCLPLAGRIFLNLDYCPSGHLLNFSKIPKLGSTSPHFICDSCKTSYNFVSGRFCCLTCDFNFCPSCKTKLFCPKEHCLLWSKEEQPKADYYCCEKCNSNQPCKNYRWLCPKCNYNLCIQCSLSLIPIPKPLTLQPRVLNSEILPVEGSASLKVDFKYICKICFLREVDTFLIPCGHSFCSDCANKFTKCPIDREMFTERKTLFFS